jgi:hypothetical protein
MNSAPLAIRVAAGSLSVTERALFEMLTSSRANWWRPEDIGLLSVWVRLEVWLQDNLDDLTDPATSDAYRQLLKQHMAIGRVLRLTPEARTTTDKVPGQTGRINRPQGATAAEIADMAGADRSTPWRD